MAGLETLCVIAFVASVSAVTVDRTLSPESTGKVIVDAVVDRIRSNCIFGNDRLFLRRLAYVETSDGEDPKTYRPNYHGGIWQIDEDKFRNISCSNPHISGTCDLVKSTFNISWPSVIWSDLRTPLFSGLAAALFIHGTTRTPPIDLSTQAQFWVNYIRPGGIASDFENKVRQLKGSNCKTEIDLAFLLDGSGSVSMSDFTRMLNFVKTVVDKLEVNDEEVHVSVLEYASSVGDTITFNEFTSKANLITAIGNIRKPGGGTSTHLAIQYSTSVLFNTTTGARPGAKRVAILLTDGASNNFALTVTAAEKAKARGIIMVTVGVGNPNLLEIESIATAPNCTHSFVLQNFLEMDSLLYQLKDRSCSASTSLPPIDEERKKSRKIPENSTVTETFGVNLPKHENRGNGTKEDLPDSSDMQPVIKTEVQCGNLEIFASYNIPRPGPAFYDIHDSARDDKPSLIYLNSTLQGKPLYITVVASSDPAIVDVSSCLNASYNISLTTVPRKADVVCRVGDTVRMCTNEDFRNSEYSFLQCQDQETNNPCAAGQVSVHEHPSDMTKFIHCDVTGKIYITQCPNEETFNVNTESCGIEAVGPNNGSPLPATLTNECTTENLARRKFHFKNPDDVTSYIQCDAFGRAWVKPCPQGLHWSESDNTCSHPRVFNPCQGANNGATFAHDQPDMYILCSFGKEHVMPCAPGLVFDSALKMCDFPSL